MPKYVQFFPLTNTNSIYGITIYTNFTYLIYILWYKLNKKIIMKSSLKKAINKPYYTNHFQTTSNKPNTNPLQEYNFQTIFTFYTFQGSLSFNLSLKCINFP